MSEQNNEEVQSEIPGTTSTSDTAETAISAPRTKKKLIIGAIVAAVALAAVTSVLFATHVLCIHQWSEATCTEPQICSICNRTQGDPLGHEANDWKTTKEATCTAEGMEQGRCIRCGELQSRTIPKTPHTEGHWETTRDWKLNSSGGVESGEHELRCTVCGELLKTEEFKPELTTAEEGACKFAMQMLFSDTGMSRDFLIQQLETQGFTEAESTLAIDHCGVDWNEEAVKSAKFYLKTSGGSRDMVMSWLSIGHFTDEQANYACDQVGL